MVQQSAHIERPVIADNKLAAYNQYDRTTVDNDNNSDRTGLQTKYERTYVITPATTTQPICFIKAHQSIRVDVPFLGTTIFSRNTANGSIFQHCYGDGKAGRPIAVDVWLLSYVIPVRRADLVSRDHLRALYITDGIRNDCIHCKRRHEKLDLRYFIDHRHCGGRISR